MKKLTPFMVGFALFFSVFCYAEESLNSFQQEIVYAKQKQQSIAQKMDSVNVALDQEKSVYLEKEAQDLITELTRSGYEQGPKEIKLTPSTQKPQQTSPLAAPVAEKPKAKKGWFAPKYREPKLSEGQMLYKVAVSDGKITVEEAVEIGLANNLQTKSAAQKIEVAKSKRNEASRALFPTVQLVAVLPNSSGGKQPSTTQPTPRTFRTQSYKVNVNQPLYYGGELILTAKQADENVRNAEAEYAKAKNEFVQQVRSAYYGAVKAEYNVEYEVALYNQTNVVYKRILDAHREKVISEVEYLNTESQYHQVFFQMESANNDLLSANISLVQTIGLNAKEPLPLDLKLNFEKKELNFEDLLEQGYKYNPDLKAKEFTRESAKYGLEVYAAKKRPHFDLRGSYGTSGEGILDDATYSTFTSEDTPTPTRGINDKLEVNQEKEWFFGIKGSMPLGPNSVEWEQVKHVYAPSVISPTGGSEDWSQKLTFNIMDKFAEITDEKSARGALLQAEADLDKTKNELTLKIREDYYNIQKSLIQIDSSIAKIRYQEKQNSILEYLVGLQESQPANLIEGYIELTQDKFSFIQAVVDYNLAVSSLGVSLGDPNIFSKKGSEPS